MICLAAIDNKVFTEYLIKKNESKNFLIFIRNLLYEYNQTGSNIILADNLNGELTLSIHNYIRNNDDQLSGLLIDLLTLIQSSEIKPLIRSLVKNPSESSYVDFKITYQDISNEKFINIEDNHFEEKIQNKRKSYKSKITSNMFKENPMKFTNNMEKIFLASKKNTFLRFDMGGKILPFTNQFKKVSENGFAMSDFKKSISTIFFILNSLIEIKKESTFLDKNSPINLNIFTFVDNKSLRENDFYTEDDLLDIEDILKANLSHFNSLKSTLEKNKINLTFNIFIFQNKDEHIRSKIKDEIHFRYLYTSNGIFHFDHDFLASVNIAHGPGKMKVSKIGKFNIQKTVEDEYDQIKSMIFNNSEGVFLLKSNFP